MTTRLANLFDSLRASWTYVRAVTGDDSFERYLEHHELHHVGTEPMTRKAHFDFRQEQKWSGVSRCC